MRIPFGFLSDAPTTKTGLGRITREIAMQTHEHLGDVFEVATIGLGGHLSRKLPFKQYQVSRLEPFPPELPDIWRLFAGNQKGILLTIANPCWLAFLSGNLKLPAEYQAWLDEKPFEVWSYVPIDAVGPNDRLCTPERIILEKMDRVLAYGEWGANVLDRTLNRIGTKHLPHGINSEVFYPRDRKEARATFVKRTTDGKMDGVLADDYTLVGIVATNTRRKDWYLAFEIGRELMKRGVKFGFWAHTNKLIGEWDLLTLAEEFGMAKHVLFSTANFSDDDMAWAYSACDFMLGIGSGEGWGLPMSEALGCGIPVLHGNYAGATDFIPPGLLIEPIAMRGDGVYCARRPVYRAADWADKIELFTKPLPGGRKWEPVNLDPKYYWENCWPRWEEWLREGIE